MKNPWIEALRIALFTCWIIPVSWLFSGQIQAPLGPVPSLLPILLASALGAFALRSLSGLGFKPRSLGYRATGAAIMLVAVAAAAAVSMQIGMAIDQNSMGVLVVVLLAELITMAQISTTEPTYPVVRAAFGVGLLGLTITLAVAAASNTTSITLRPLGYSGIVGYIIAGVVSIGIARRIAIEETGPKRRVAGLESDWLRAMVAIAGGLTILGLVFIEIFGFDIIGGITAVLSRPWDGVAWLIENGLGGVVAGLYAFGSLFGYKAGKPHRPRSLVKSKPHGGNGGHKRYNAPTHHVSDATLVLRGLEIGVAAAIVLFIVLYLLRRRSRDAEDAATGTDEGERTSAWSSRKSFSWLLRRARRELDEFLPSLPRLRRPPMETVRDVYRAFLALGKDREKPRYNSETGIEYGGRLSQAWVGSRPTLDDLNALYMEERYGARPVSAQSVASAVKHLNTLETISKPD